MPAILRRDLEYLIAFQGPAENPLLGDGRWLNGQVDGVGWTNFQSSPVLGAYGTMLGPSPPYSDSCLYRLPPPGQVWSADTEIETQIQVKNQGAFSGFHELEHLHRGRISANFNTCYEFILSVGPTTYCEAVIWNGPLGVVVGGDGAFTFLTGQQPCPLPGNGDWFKSTCIGNLLRMYHRTDAGSYGAPLFTYDIRNTSLRLWDGYPGLGWWKNGAQTAQDDYSFLRARFSAGWDA